MVINYSDTDVKSLGKANKKKAIIRMVQNINHILSKVVIYSA